MGVLKKCLLEMFLLCTQNLCLIEKNLILYNLLGGGGGGGL